MKRVKRTSILSDADVRVLTAGVKKLLPGDLPEHLLSRVNIEAGIRFGAVAAKCRERRERRGLTVKEAARQLRVPQFRLNAIEGGRLSEVRADVLLAYVAFLELRPWLVRWRRANPSLSRQLGLTTRERVEHSRGLRRAV
jgi:hypothetical protein